MKKSILAISTVAVMMSSGFASAVDFGDNLFFDVGSYGTTDTFNVIGSNVDATSTYTAPAGTTNADNLIGQTVAVEDTVDNGNVNALLLETVGIGDTAGLNSNYNILLTYTLNGTATFVDGLGDIIFQDGTLDAYTVCQGASDPSPQCGAGNGAGDIVAGADGLIDGAVEPELVAGTTPSGFIGGDAINPDFSTGTITLTFEDLNGSILSGGAGDTLKLVDLELTGSSVSGADVVLFTEADYSWYDAAFMAGLTAAEQALIEDFFNFVNAIDIGGTDYNSWYDIWANGTDVGLPIVLAQRTDFNVDPDEVPTCDNADCTTLSRSTNLNVTTEARLEVEAIPEPGLLALMSMGMLAVGFVGRRSRRAKKA